MGDDIKRTITADRYLRAAVFGPELCRPVKALIRGFEGKLPPDQVLTVGPELASGSAYFAADSGLAEYYLRALQGFKERVKGEGIRPEFFTRQYDPAIAFFKKQIAQRRAIRLGCERQMVDAVAPAMVPLSKNAVDLRAIKAALKDRFGMDVADLREVWPAHRVFMSDIRKGKDLVIVLPDIHHIADPSIAYMKLVDRLLQQGDRIDVRYASEGTPEGMKETLQKARTGELYQELKRVRLEGKNATELLLACMQTEAVKDAFRREMMGKDAPLPASLAKWTAFYPSLRTAVISTIVDGQSDRLWRLDDPRLYEKIPALYVRGQKMPDSAPLEDKLSLMLELHETQVRRSIVMSHNLVRLARQQSPGKKPRIILFNVGAAHAFDVIRTLQAKGDFSIVGLLPDNFTADVLKDIAKAPK